VGSAGESLLRKRLSQEAALLLIENPSQNIAGLKNLLCEKYGISYPKNSEILNFIPLSQPKLRRLLLKAPTRTLSGISPIAIMPPPLPCGGHCTYCPKGEGAPQSYTGYEPTTLRAIQCGYSASRQIASRLSQYGSQGHIAEKCHLSLWAAHFSTAGIRCTGALS